MFSWIKSKPIKLTVTVLTHAVLWAIFLGLPHLASFDPPVPPANINQFNEFDPAPLKLDIFIFNVIAIGFFYLNLYFLVPRIMNEKGWKVYLLAVFGSLIAGLIIHSIIGRLLGINIDREHWPPTALLVFVFLAFGLVSTSIRLTLDRIQFDKERKERETENLKSELSLLRSQVSPHFMFNVLNSITSLARKKSDQIEFVTIQLSKLMRYMLYENDVEKITIEREVDYVRSFINLQMIRFGDDVTVKFRTDVEEKDQQIEPMLLIPFVENAFKHGIGMVSDPVIEIELFSQQTFLSFIVRNKVSKTIDTAKDASSGIGLANLKRRLKLLYPKHEITTGERNGCWFHAELKIYFA